MRSKPKFNEIIPKFTFDGEFLRAEPYGFGHINDTYTAYFRKADGEEHRYIVQRINHDVFKKPEGLMLNILGVTEHIRKKIEANGGNPDRETLTLIPTKEGKSFFRTPSGNYWRAYLFIEGAQTYQIPVRLEQVKNAAYAFGKFQQYLEDYPADELIETIPDFHHTVRRLEHFQEILEADTFNRAFFVQDEINFVLQRTHETSLVVDLIKSGQIPLRVTHNDTKFNNVMIDDEDGSGICVIDLDTVMPGSLLYDFGDAIRSITNTAEEDERDLDKVHFDMDVFRTYVEGYQQALLDTCLLEEIENLAFSARLLTLECGMRFLTDYLDGDQYYKIHRENHNLDRCRTQFRLVVEMEEKYSEMQAAVSDAFRKV